jgi:hypothetical protein
MSKGAMTKIFILVSFIMIEWSYKLPICPFLMGIVVGHLFWRMGDSEATHKISDFVHEKETKLSNKGEV